MSDIIQRAKNLLDNTTPGPWLAADSDILKESNGEFIGTISEYSGIDFESKESANTRLAAASPELAQALAEEEYQYGVSYIGMSRSGLHIEWVEPTGDPEFDKYTLQRIKKHWEKWGQTPKIVRRRVSKPELVNEAN